jgi:signal transduction histidine kinase
MNFTRPPLAITLDPIRNAFLEAKKRGVHLRYLTEVTKDNLSYCKELLNIVGELHHLEGIKGNFMISESEYIAPLILFERGRVASQAVYSNIKEVVAQQQHIFENFWSKSTSAINKIKEIEEGIEPEFLEVITNEQDASNILLELSRSVKKEALFILPSYNSMEIVDRLGVIDSLINASHVGAVVKIICPLSEKNSHIVGKLSKNAPTIEILNAGTSAAAGVLIVDGTKFSRTELGVRSSDGAVGSSQTSRFTVYSNSRPTVELFRSIFGLLWNERTLNEQLKITEDMQKNFINIAAHELRTPIQPILGISQILANRLADTEFSEYLNIIVKNALKLQRLTEDILDVQRIESNTMTLKSEPIQLNKLVSDIAIEHKDQLRRKIAKDEGADLELIFVDGGTTITVLADRFRIAQVISNLLNNAIKFTNKGRITIRLEESRSSEQPEAIVSITDSGEGIDSHILPRIFSRFVSKSYQGTGLGLFISKGIVEAHGGKIWGKNNADGIGATFTLSLPSVL